MEIKTANVFTQKMNYLDRIINLYTKKLVIFFLLLAPCVFIKAQITIGTLTSPAKGSLLELKTQETTSPVSSIDISNVTSTKGGLGLPCVSLVDKTTLEPFISIGDVDWANASINKIKDKHIGLMVYNTYTSSDIEVDRNKIFRQGIYTWNGEEWSLAFKNSPQISFFPCPPFNLPLPAISEANDPDLSFDLYAVYQQRFTKSGNNLFTSSNTALDMIPAKSSDKLYSKTELDYVVVHYDESVLTISGIDPDGVMKYRVKSVNPKPTSFINILFIIRD